ncbi:PQQ-binding-like beta-propeller repeat protein [Candidatus Woesearchaeota archaeon]|nr:PQQ-binding-like beta-propeller repeat protein [Candidatus Woesearchaeota archaeon]
MLRNKEGKFDIIPLFISNYTPDFITEIDGNVSDGQEIIISTSNADFTDGRVYALDGDTNNVLWTFNDPNASEHPSVDDADGDGVKEVIKNFEVVSYE